MSLLVKSLRSKISKSLFSYSFLSMICSFEPNFVEIRILKSGFILKPIPKKCILFKKKSNFLKMSLLVKSLRSKNFRISFQLFVPINNMQLWAKSRWNSDFGKWFYSQTHPKKLHFVIKKIEFFKNEFARKISQK